MPAKTKKKKDEVEEKEQHPLPDEDVYTCQVVDVYYRDKDDLPTHPEYPARDRVDLVVDLLDTENGDTDTPFQVTVFLNEVQRLTFQREGATRETNLYKFFDRCGLEPPKTTRFKDIDWEEMRGLFLEGKVTHRESPKNGLTYANLAIANIETLRDKKKKEENAEKRDAIFGLE